MAHTEAPFSMNAFIEDKHGIRWQLTFRTGADLDAAREVWQVGQNVVAGILKSSNAPANNNGHEPPPEPQPPQEQPTPANGQAPLCPTHGTPMRESQYGGWYCPVKVADDGGDGRPVYCRQKVKA